MVVWLGVELLCHILGLRRQREMKNDYTRWRRLYARTTRRGKVDLERASGSTPCFFRPPAWPTRAVPSLASYRASIRQARDVSGARFRERAAFKHRIPPAHPEV